MKNLFYGFMACICLMMSTESIAQQANSASSVSQGMIKVSIFYPNAEGKTFNMDYYAQKHMPMAKVLFGESLLSFSIDKGLANGIPNAPLPYLAIGYFYFKSMADLQKAMSGTASAKLTADIPNFTNSQPIIQISEVVQ